MQTECKIIELLLECFAEVPPIFAVFAAKILNLQNI